MCWRTAWKLVCTFMLVFWKSHISKLTLLLLRNTRNVGRNSKRPCVKQQAAFAAP